MTEFKIQNMVGSHDVGFNIMLERFCNAPEQKNYCKYDPEMFPGLIYRMFDPKVVLLIFSSGKIVLTGAKERKQINQAYNNIANVLKQYKHETQPIQPSYVRGSNEQRRL